MRLIDKARHAVRQKYLFPGGYPLYLLCADGGILCPDCARREWKLVAAATRHPGTDKQWEIVAIDVNWEDSDLTCDNCGETVESAYGDDSEEEEEEVTTPPEPLDLVQFVGDFFQMPRSKS